VSDLPLSNHEEKMEEQLSELLELAKRAARAAADVHRCAIEKGRFEAQTKASSSDLVTAIDREAEQVLVTVIRAARPQDEIVGEEGANLRGDSGVRWILDPLDGTTNFVHRYPAHSVAVGVEIHGHRTMGVVHDTFNHRVYSGVVGQGATCDGQPLAVRNETELSRALVGTGFLPNAEARRLQADLLRAALPRVRDIRRSGCPSLDICNVASGALDAFYECGLGQWDIAAATAIAEAAGAAVRLLRSALLPNPMLVVANTKLAEALVAALKEAGAIEGDDP
jgi:Archaeal fructose-1,6-bisphosphatase and related enzymes of inositol monophosphatase family